MTRRLLAFVVLSLWATPALAKQIYLVFDRVTVFPIRRSPDMRLIGIYKSEAEARSAMSEAKECKYQ
jgi:hypothetical protein